MRHIASGPRNFSLPLTAVVLSRTFRTSLSDDELMLFDVLFDGWDSPDSLLRENYGPWHNLPYAHNLDAAELSRTIQALIERGLIRSRTEAGPRRQLTWLTLTDRGGHLWTLERDPDWDRYCTDASWPSEKGDDAWILSVRSPALETARAFLKTASRCNLYDVDLDQVTRGMNSSEDLSPWQTFEAVHELQVRIPDQGVRSVDWTLYENERTWWRNLQELQKIDV